MEVPGAGQQEPGAAAAPGQEIDLSLDDIIQRNQRAQPIRKPWQQRQLKTRNGASGNGRPQFQSWGPPTMPANQVQNGAETFKDEKVENAAHFWSGPDCLGVQPPGRPPPGNVPPHQRPNCGLVPFKHSPLLDTDASWVEAGKTKAQCPSQTGELKLEVTFGWDLKAALKHEKLSANLRGAKNTTHTASGQGWPSSAPALIAEGAGAAVVLQRRNRVRDVIPEAQEARPKAQGPSDAPPRLNLEPPLRTAKEEIRDIVVQEGTFLQGSYFKTILAGPPEDPRFPSMSLDFLFPQQLLSKWLSARTAAEGLVALEEKKPQHLFPGTKDV
ncbi:hypothetical protein Chor_004746 [Crotalus horridus]